MIAIIIFITIRDIYLLLLRKQKATKAVIIVDKQLQEYPDRSKRNLIAIAAVPKDHLSSLGDGSRLIQIPHLDLL